MIEGPVDGLVDGPVDSLRFTIRCDDFTGRKEHTWISTRCTATTDWQTFRIPLVDRQVTDGNNFQDRIFDRRDVDRVMISRSAPDAESVLEIDNLRLE